MRNILIMTIAAFGLAGCGGGVPVQTKWKTVTVTTRGPCPEPGVYDSIKSSRPPALRTQRKPATPAERVARTSAQLGLYEAEGGWGDKAMAALSRCQQGTTERLESEGVAPVK